MQEVIKKFSVYTIRKGKNKANAQFYPSSNLPKGTPITTPFTFPFLSKKKVVLAKDKMGWWNPVGGHIEEGESWQEALKRESLEEAGVKITDIIIFGYVLIKQTKQKIIRYPDISVLPFTWSKVDQYISNWTNMETRGRKTCSIEKARKLFKLRSDNNQMLEIFDYLVKCRASKS